MATEIDVARLIERWGADRDLALRSIQVYSLGARDFARWWETNHPGEALTSATTPEIRQYLDHVAIDHARPGLTAAGATINSYRASVWALFEALIFAGGAHVNPVTRVRGIRLGAGRPRWLSLQEEARLAAILPRLDAWEQLAILLMLRAGLRRGEVLAITWGQIQGRRLRVTGKGRRERVVPVAADLADALAAWRRRPFIGGHKVGVAASDRIIPSSPEALWRHVRRAAKAAGVKPFTPHALRHSFCHRLAAQGVRLEVIAALAGHGSLETTRRYVEPDDAELERAMQETLR